MKTKIKTLFFFFHSNRFDGLVLVSKSLHNSMKIVCFMIRSGKLTKIIKFFNFHGHYFSSKFHRKNYFMWMAWYIFVFFSKIMITNKWLKNAQIK